jgi:hypothetical protein
VRTIRIGRHLLGCLGAAVLAVGVTAAAGQMPAQAAGGPGDATASAFQGSSGDLFTYAAGGLGGTDAEMMARRRPAA